MRTLKDHLQDAENEVERCGNQQYRHDVVDALDPLFLVGFRNVFGFYLECQVIQVVISVCGVKALSFDSTEHS